MKNRGEINVTKYSGEKAPFDVDKLRQSLQRSGATEKVIDAVVEQVLQSLYENISTKGKGGWKESLETHRNPVSLTKRMKKEISTGKQRYQTAMD